VSELGALTTVRAGARQFSSGFVEVCLTKNKVGCSTVNYIIEWTMEVAMVLAVLKSR